MTTTEQFVTEEFPWVVVANWRDSSPTLHGGFRTAEAAERSAAGAWRDNPACTRWQVLLMQDPPVPQPRRGVGPATRPDLGDGSPLADRIRARMTHQADEAPMSDALACRIADVLAGL